MYVAACVIAVFIAGGIGAAAAQGTVNADLEPLSAYQGTWHVTRNNASGSKPDTLINKCAVLGQFFACAQNVNGQPGGLIVFFRHGEPGHYFTQTILPDGHASGVTNLEIHNGTWLYTERRNENGKTTYYKTINAFSGKNKIHFETSHSTDGKDFTVDASGDETRVTR